MIHRTTRRAAAFAALVAFTPLPAFAEFLDPDWAALSIEGVAQPDWIAGVREGDYIGMCLTCDGTMMLQVQVRPDDGTGGRVHSGETTAETYTALGEANAAQIGNAAAYYGTEAVDFAAAKGFKTAALGATGDYSTSYQLWDDGHQLIVKVYGKDQAAVEAMADKVYKATVPLTFR